MGTGLPLSHPEHLSVASTLICCGFVFPQEHKAFVSEELTQLAVLVAVAGGVVSAAADLWSGAACWWDWHHGLVPGRRDGAVSGVWILAPSLGWLMVH